MEQQTVAQQETPVLQGAPPPAMTAAPQAPQAHDEPPVGAQLRSDVVLILEKTPEGAVLRIQGHDQNLAEFRGPMAVGLARQALVDVQRAIVKYAYQTAFVYVEMMARQHERQRLEAALRTIDPSLQQLQTELRSLTEY